MKAVDTNVFVYLFDVDEPAKQAQARDCLDGLVRARVDTVLLWQVASEVLGKLRKWHQAGKVSAADCERNYQDVIRMFPLVLPVAAILDTSRRLTARYSLSHWDSMLVAAAIEAGVTTLYTEDLQAGATYETVAIVNPFATA
jgi:predicted nucleic acid-binding protein